jgi:hypothetical protein
VRVGSREEARRAPSPPRLRGGALRLVTAALLVMALAELGVRAAAPKLREPLLWADWEAQNKVAAMDRLARRGGASVVLLGSSMMNAAANAEALGAALGVRRPAFNAALNGADLRTVELWARRIVVPRLRPRIVVIGFNAGEFNANGDIQNELYGKLVESPLGRAAIGGGSVLDRLESWLVQRSYLIRYRSVLRQPWDAAVGQDPGRRRLAVTPAGTLEIIDRFHARPYTPGAARQLANWDRAFTRYAPGGPQRAALERLVRDLVRQGVTVIVVRMPVTGDLARLLPRGTADLEAFGRALAAFVSSHPVRFVDADAALGGDTSLFTDPLHLNAAGAARFTAILADALRSS